MTGVGKKAHCKPCHYSVVAKLVTDSKPENNTCVPLNRIMRHILVFDLSASKL